ncbi:hypothetical protein ACN5LY_000785 [Cronobacter dublinensis]|uniref:hypothetical protein n=1 Tax=Cronobacter dublinensis TaxID=413497 RepID=UPI0024AEE97F|nr:hypothetical protein [Cronobacter dublinensis]MDI7504563.1 hypothetical protein [Cronobacter dublinensis]
MFFNSKNKEVEQTITTNYLKSIGELKNSFTLGDGDFIDLQLPTKYIEFKKSRSSNFNSVIVLNKPVDQDEFDSVKINIKIRREDYGNYIDIKGKVFYTGDDKSMQEFISYLNSCI